MSRDELHARASDSTPTEVTIPNSWAGLIVWAVGKWGAGAIFACMLVWVYTDLQKANASWVGVVRANTEVIQQLVRAVEANNDEIRELRYQRNKP